MKTPGARGQTLSEELTDLGYVPSAGGSVDAAALAALGVSTTTTVTIPQLDLYCLHKINGIRTFAIANAGTGFSVDDYLDVAGGNSDAQLRVRAVDGGGAITLAEIVTEDENMVGSGYSVASGVALSGGTGTGATINILSVGGPYTILAAPGAGKVRLPERIILIPSGTIGYNGTATWIEARWNNWGEIFINNGVGPLNGALSAGVLIGNIYTTTISGPRVAQLYEHNPGNLNESANLPVMLQSDGPVYKVIDGIATWQINQAGTNYQVGGYFTSDGGQGTMFRVDAVDGNGGVTAATMLSGGAANAVANNVTTGNNDISPAGATGSGLTIDVLTLGASDAVGKVIVRYEDVTLP